MSQHRPFAALEVTEENWLKPNALCPRGYGANRRGRTTTAVALNVCSRVCVLGHSCVCSMASLSNWQPTESCFPSGWRSSARRSSSFISRGNHGQDTGQSHHHLRRDGRHAHADHVVVPAADTRPDRRAVDRSRPSRRSDPAPASRRTGSRRRTRRSSTSSCRALPRGPMR